MKTITVFAPATVANVAVGFDILGFAFDGLGDYVTVERLTRHKNEPASVKISELSWITAQKTPTDLPLDPHLNTATIGLLKLIDLLKLDHGFKVTIKKGIPIGSGIGGSAASSVAAMVAANALLATPLPSDKLLEFIVAGEILTSGSAHFDNVVPCLLGGLQLIHTRAPMKIVAIPVPAEILCVIVYPHLTVRTKHARKILKKTVLLEDWVQQSANLGILIAGCFKNDLNLIGHGLRDLLIEPQRASLVNNFEQIKQAAIDAGVLGCSFSGSGPSVFGLTVGLANAERVKTAMLAAFKRTGIGADAWISKISPQGARIIA